MSANPKSAPATPPPAAASTSTRVQTPQVTPAMSNQPQQPASNGNGGGINIPSWFLQFITMVTLLAGGLLMFARMSADIEKLKEAQAEQKTFTTSMSQEFVSKQIFDMKMVENEKYQIQMNQRFDKLEGLINGLYDRLPAKRSEK